MPYHKLINEWLAEYKALSDNQYQGFSDKILKNSSLFDALSRIFEEPTKRNRDLLPPVCHQLFRFYVNGIDDGKSPKRVISGLRTFTISLFPSLFDYYLASYSAAIQEDIVDVETLLVGIYHLESINDGSGQPRIQSFRIPNMLKPSIYHDPQSTFPIAEFVESSAKRENVDICRKGGMVYEGCADPLNSINAKNRLKMLTWLLRIYNMNLSLLSNCSLQAMCRFVSGTCRDGFEYLSFQNFSSDVELTNDDKNHSSPSLPSIPGEKFLSSPAAQINKTSSGKSSLLATPQSNSRKNSLSLPIDQGTTRDTPTINLNRSPSQRRHMFKFESRPSSVITTNNVTERVHRIPLNQSFLVELLHAVCFSMYSNPTTSAGCHENNNKYGVALSYNKNSKQLKSLSEKINDSNDTDDDDEEEESDDDEIFELDSSSQNTTELAIGALDDIHNRAAFELWEDVLLVTNAMRNTLHEQLSSRLEAVQRETGRAMVDEVILKGALVATTPVGVTTPARRRSSTFQTQVLDPNLYDLSRPRFSLCGYGMASLNTLIIGRPDDFSHDEKKFSRHLTTNASFRAKKLPDDIDEIPPDTEAATAKAVQTNDDAATQRSRFGSSRKVNFGKSDKGAATAPPVTGTSSIVFPSRGKMSRAMSAGGGVSQVNPPSSSHSQGQQHKLRRIIELDSAFDMDEIPSESSNRLRSAFLGKMSSTENAKNDEVFSVFPPSDDDDNDNVDGDGGKLAAGSRHHHAKFGRFRRDGRQTSTEPTSSIHEVNVDGDNKRFVKIGKLTIKIPDRLPRIRREAMMMSFTPGMSRREKHRGRGSVDGRPEIIPLKDITEEHNTERKDTDNTDYSDDTSPKETKSSSSIKIPFLSLSNKESSSSRGKTSDARIDGETEEGLTNSAPPVVEQKPDSDFKRFSKKLKPRLHLPGSKSHHKEKIDKQSSHSLSGMNDKLSPSFDNISPSVSKDEMIMNDSKESTVTNEDANSNKKLMKMRPIDDTSPNGFSKMNAVNDTSLSTIAESPISTPKHASKTTT